MKIMADLFATIVGMLVFSGLAFAAEAPLRLTERVPLAGVTGRIDHMAADAVGQKLYIAALGNNSLEVVDLRQGRRVRSLTGFREPQGVALLGQDRLAVAAGGDGACLIYDTAAFNLITRIDNLEDADNLRYDGVGRSLYVGYGKGAIGVFDDGFHRVGTIPLPDHPEGFARGGDGRIYVNVPSERSILIADGQKERIIDNWRLKAGGNFPLTLDEVNRLVFVASRKPPTLLVLAMQSGEVTATVPLDGDADDLFLDARRDRIYVSCGAGYLDVIERRGRAEYQLTARIPTAAGARTSLFVPEIDRLFLAVPERGAQKAEVRVYQPTP